MNTSPLCGPDFGKSSERVAAPNEERRLHDEIGDRLFTDNTTLA